ncbi:MAG TPA: hypothetical protein PKD90_20145 [Phnomibacter sp.]|nr:hypothetical protein [Phnomibacter sp.]
MIIFQKVIGFYSSLPAARPINSPYSTSTGHKQPSLYFNRPLAWPLAAFIMGVQAGQRLACIVAQSLQTQSFRQPSPTFCTPL